MGGYKTYYLQALINSMDTIYQQIFSSQIAYHYNKALDKFIGDIPLNEDLEALPITRISYFQNDDEAQNMTRFTKTELHRVLLHVDLPVQISTHKGYTLHC
jgi:hypothetical protein